jgi:hypothetical protein
MVKEKSEKKTSLERLERVVLDLQNKVTNWHYKPRF